MEAILQRLPAISSKRSGESGSRGSHTLIDTLLAEQKSLQTPVARFSDVHDRGSDLAEHYRSLIPLTKPGAGEQYAFEVSLDRCTGCKACVSACHSLNGLDDEEAWRDVGTLLADESTPGWQQTITTACHHCGDPACLNGCPVGAYEKDANTGIVRHLDDQCIGCSYCILKCPYDVPKYSKKHGIVRKCDMCHQRLAEGEAPACVQACPTEAIRIVKVDAPVRSRARATNLLSRDFDLRSAITDSKITLPTTRYIGREIPPHVRAADRETLVPQHAHWPLVFMLSFTQAGIGLLAAAAVTSSAASLAVSVAATMVFMAGMGASMLHLGQPLKAWRFFLGLRTSWLSREILAFSMFAPIPMGFTALQLLPDFPFKSELAALARHSIIPVGCAAVFTSVMIYVDTHRASWRFPLTASRFFGTMLTFLALGCTILHPAFLTISFLAIAVIAKLVPEMMVLRLADRKRPEWSPDLHSARIQRGPLKLILIARLALPVIAVLCAFISPWVSSAFLLGAEVLERQLFFQSAFAPKMPGNFGPAPGR